MNALKQGRCFIAIAIRRVQVYQDGFKLDGTHQLLDYADDFNILGGSLRTRKEDGEALVTARKENGLEVNADKTTYTVMSRDLNVGPSDSIKIDYSPFERVEEFNNLGTTLTNQNSIQGEIKCRLKSGNVCYHLLQNLLSSSLLSKNTSIKIKIYRTIILPVV